MVTAAHEYPEIGLLIDGRWEREAAEHFDVRNPADESIVGRVPVATPADIERSVQAAQRGFEVWRRTAPAERSKLLIRAAALLRERVESIATHITLELGKTLAEARAEVVRAADILEWDANQALRLHGRINPSAPGWRQMVLRQPIGPVAAFTPWNAPIGSPARKVSGALAAGCSVVIKAAEETPAGMQGLAQSLVDAGLPPGVLNCVYGHPDAISRALIESPAIRLVTFTGSIAVGKQLSQLAGAHMKPVLMELGGHSPVVVCDDCDPTAVARLAATAKFRMAGQVCVSPTRFIVHERIYATFVEAFAGFARELSVGPGLVAGTGMGALANARRLEAIERLVQDALDSGARLAAGGRRIGERGFFFEPTVLADVPEHAQAMSVEPFGPLATVSAFTDLDAAIGLANRLQVGLAGYAFTQSLATAERLADELQTGLLSINHFGAAAPDMPFGGLKDSGMGREGGAESLDAYTVTRMVSMRTQPWS
ncbi:MAG: NAD-dependent succinate-semialdehyde dehydrogenase [Gammaproteobacteria bacterium]|nr:NAD-dependent succinate-semialdehyde dehydrogenase [Gammaproteobacteria bacterium]MBU1440225.1 NAD-dependent succinate-semialdehyde dehydrogenase [Gammaproteobacteria bacterium]MBU2408150.1 NAD-dependent succinate-semialdehyde dehydrogenase [Gammaproteobacteria bacterium]